jgi:hypothetical protein
LHEYATTTSFGTYVLKPVEKRTRSRSADAIGAQLGQSAPQNQSLAAMAGKHK